MSLVEDIESFRKEMSKDLNRVPTQVIVPACIPQEEVERVLGAKCEVAIAGLGWVHYRVVK